MTSFGRVTVTPVEEAREVSAVVLSAEEAQSNFAFVQVVLLPVVEQ